MLGASMYLSGREVDTGEYIQNASSCSMCKRLIINAGILNVYVRDTLDTWHEIQVEDWIKNDESLEEGVFGY